MVAGSGTTVILATTVPGSSRFDATGSKVTPGRLAVVTGDPLLPP